jgi:hypothetical protein
MFNDREPSIFPHPASAWWVPVLLGVGWGPLFVADLLYPQNWKVAEGFGMGWGIGIALPCTVLSAVSVVAQAFRLIAYFRSRPKPASK